MAQGISNQFVSSLRWQLSAYNQIHEMIGHVCDEPGQIPADGQLYTRGSPKAVMIMLPVLFDGLFHYLLFRKVTKDILHSSTIGQMKFFNLPIHTVASLKC
jgi:hypothetical protein